MGMIEREGRVVKSTEPTVRAGFADHGGRAQVELQGVSKSFGAAQALRDVSFAVGQGEVVALLGPNGAGKTTAISIMLGLRTPTTGRARLLGLDPRDLRARSRCGVMLQESGVPMMLTVRELVDLFRGYYPAPLPAGAAINLWC